MWNDKGRLGWTSSKIHNYQIPEPQWSNQTQYYNLHRNTITKTRMGQNFTSKHYFFLDKCGNILLGDFRNFPMSKMYMHTLIHKIWHTCFWTHIKPECPPKSRFQKAYLYWHLQISISHIILTNAFNIHILFKNYPDFSNLERWFWNNLLCYSKSLLCGMCLYQQYKYDP